MAVPSNSVMKAQVQREIARLVCIAKEQGQADRYAGKRQRTRYKAGMPFEASTEPASESAVWFVKMHNISNCGFACWSKKPVKEGTRLLVREFPDGEPKIWLPARVRHCSAGIRGYLIGAAFDLSGSGGNDEASPPKGQGKSALAESAAAPSPPLPHPAFGKAPPSPHRSA